MIVALSLLLQAAAAAPAPPWTAHELGTVGPGRTATSTYAFSDDGASRLVVRCDRGAEKVVSVQFNSRQQLGVADATLQTPDKAISLRFDDGPANDYLFEASGNALYTSDPVAVNDVTVALAKARRVQVSTTNSSNFGVAASFAGPASETAIRQVLTGCGYTFGVVTPTPSAPPAQ